MKRFNLVVLCILIGFLAFGCGKKSGLEGKVADGKGKPVANVKIIAKQVQPIKGYEQFETTTNSDGMFSFGKLFPTSEYILLPWYKDWTEAPMRTLRYKANNLVARFSKEGWTTKQKMKIQSGPEGETILLASPVVIQPYISEIQGKIVNGKGQPISNMKVIAKQVNPVPGYEQFETTTNSNGTFSFGKLFPASEYILFPWYKDWTEAPMRTLRYKANNLVARFNKEGWTTEQKMKIQGGPEGETIILASPIVIQPCISGIEGEVVDGKGQPMGKIKVIAKQIRPVPGYEQFETTTGSDGSFRFGKLFPTSEYVLIPWYEDWTEAPMRTLRYRGNKLIARFNKEGWTTEQKMKIQGGPEGETIILASPIVIQPCISGIEGKVVDGKGQPMGKIKVIAKQIRPVPGYEQFEASTGSDGTFSYGKLFPVSKYTLVPSSGDWKTSVKRVIITRGEQKMLGLKPALMIQFTMSKDGVITDSRTGLEWKAGPDKGTTWHQAKSWVQSLNLDGGGWRMPTMDELEGLYKKGAGSRNTTPLLKTTGWWVWSGETKSSSDARGLYFSDGGRYWPYRGVSSTRRAFAVRSRSDG